MDKFLTQECCDRCGKDLSSGRIMSMFNTDCICLSCKKEETLDPDYEMASKAELSEVKKGNYNFGGIRSSFYRENENHIKEVKKGKFIVFEGVDFSGKSTQVDLIKNHIGEIGLQDSFLFTKEPGSDLTDSGPKIREILLMSLDDISPAAEVFLFSADRAIHVSRIKEILNSGINVICDRYFYSTIAYQSYFGDFNKELLFNITEAAICGLVPDLLFVLNMDIETYKERRGLEKNLDRIEQNIDDAFFVALSSGYENMFNMLKEECPNLLPKKLFLIDSSKSVSDIHKTIKEVIVDFL